MKPLKNQGLIGYMMDTLLDEYPHLLTSEALKWQNGKLNKALIKAMINAENNVSNYRETDRQYHELKFFQELES